MKGLTPTQLVEITEFVQKHHRFAYVPDEDKYQGHEGYCIKYIDACYDSRQGDYWAVSFRGMGGITFTTNSLGVFNEKPAGFTYTTLYEWIMAFLKYEWMQDSRYNFMSDEKKGKLHNSFPNGVMETPWSDIDMMNAYTADLEDGSNSDDMLDACNWLIKYRDSKQG